MSTQCNTRFIDNHKVIIVIHIFNSNKFASLFSYMDYRITNRGGKGVKTINVTDKTGKLISIQAVTDDNDLMIINRSGLTIRTSADQIRVAGRATQGVRVINLREGDSIASVTAVPKTDEEEIEEIVANNEEGASVDIPAVETSENANE